MDINLLVAAAREVTDKVITPEIEREIRLAFKGAREGWGEEDYVLMRMRERDTGSTDPRRQR